jgi:hypothetical protein
LSPTRLPLLTSASPGLVALLWALSTALDIADTVMFPRGDARLVSSILYLSGASIFSGLLVAWVLRLGRSTFPLLASLMFLRLLAGLIVIALRFAAPVSLDGDVDAVADGVFLVGGASLIYFGYGETRNRWRRAAAVLVSLSVSLAAAAFLNTDDAFWNLSADIAPRLGRQVASSTPIPPPDIDDDILWGAQPALIARASAAFSPRAPGRTNVYTVAVAGSGLQALFSREAHEALRVAALHFGDESRGGVLLSNGAVDLMRSPLATRANIAAIAQAVGAKADHRRDLMFLYLVSHGGRAADLTSELANYRSVRPISSASTAEALRGAGVARRIIVISACFAATWIPALADDDTIVIAAAARDRTSFGCDDSRRLTVFGEAFLGSLARRDVSLRDAFEDARRKIAVEERKERVTPSMPQAFVGRNMQEAWASEPKG